MSIVQCSKTALARRHLREKGVVDHSQHGRVLGHLLTDRERILFIERPSVVILGRQAHSAPAARLTLGLVVDLQLCIEIADGQTHVIEHLLGGLGPLVVEVVGALLREHSLLQCGQLGLGGDEHILDVFSIFRQLLHGVDEGVGVVDGDDQTVDAVDDVGVGGNSHCEERAASSKRARQRVDRGRYRWTMDDDGARPREGDGEIVWARDV
jgi:hypothetical protein